MIFESSSWKFWSIPDSKMWIEVLIKEIMDATGWIVMVYNLNNITKDEFKVLVKCSNLSAVILVENNYVILILSKEPLDNILFISDKKLNLQDIEHNKLIVSLYSHFIKQENLPVDLLGKYRIVPNRHLINNVLDPRTYVVKDNNIH